jgi:hypothetical protein
MSKGGLPFPVQIAAAAAVGALVPLAFTQSGSSLSDLTSSLVSTVGQSGCLIKGNISINTGEHIYHVPGQEHYDETIISPQYGERWFCSEAEARAAGWRKAGR